MGRATANCVQDAGIVGHPGDYRVMALYYSIDALTSTPSIKLVSMKPVLLEVK